MFNRVMKMSVCLCIVISFIFSIQNVSAEDIITSRVGTIRITYPDGVILTFGEYEPLPAITSGTVVEVLDGSIDVAPIEGFIQIVVANSVAMVKAGDSISASIYPKTQMAGFNVNIGKVDIITSTTTTSVKEGQEVQIGFDKLTGAVKVGSIYGNVEIVTGGISALIQPFGFAQMRVDPQTQQVHIDSINGILEVSSTEGEILVLTPGESVDIQGSDESVEMPEETSLETPTEMPSDTSIEVPAQPVEEPSEPEVPEASPYRP